MVISHFGFYDIFIVYSINQTINGIQDGMVVVLVSSSVTLVLALILCAWFKTKVVYCLSCCDRFI
jgi:hypothetical protein